MINEIRGLGMLTAIEFRAPKRLRLRIPFEAFARIHPAMFGQVLVMHLFRDQGILTQICGNNFMVLKIAPPLIVTDDQLEQFVGALSDIVELMHSGSGFWSEALRYGASRDRRHLNHHHKDAQCILALGVNHQLYRQEVLREKEILPPRVE